MLDHENSPYLETCVCTCLFAAKMCNHNKCNTVTKYDDTCQSYQLLLYGSRLIELLDKCVQSIDLTCIAMTSWFWLRWLKLLSSNTTWIGNSYEGFGSVSCRCCWQCWSPVDQSGHCCLLLAATAVKRHNSSSTQGCQPSLRKVFNRQFESEKLFSIVSAQCPYCSTISCDTIINCLTFRKYLRNWLVGEVCSARV